MPLSIRPARAGDRDGIRRTLLESFPSPEEAALADELCAAPAAAFALVAETRADEIIGCVLVSSGAIARQADNSSESVWCVAPLAVTPEKRRQGVGAALMRAACAAALARDPRAIFLLGDPDYYRRFGFEPAVPLGFTSRFLTPDVPQDAFLVRRGPLAIPRPGAVEHHPAFDRFLP